MGAGAVHAGVKTTVDRDSWRARRRAPVASSSSAPQNTPEPPPQPATPSSLLALAVPESADATGLGIAVKQPPPVGLRRTVMFWSVGVAVRHESLAGRRVTYGGGARPLGGLVHRAGAASGDRQGSSSRAPAHVLPLPS